MTNTEKTQNYRELCTNGKLEERIRVLFETHIEAENCDGVQRKAGTCRYAC
jgi:hypothetical protein